MKHVFEILTRLDGLAPNQWVGLIALCAIALAGFALYVVHSIVKGGKQ
jgi:hypothetical protein